MMNTIIFLIFSFFIFFTGCKPAEICNPSIPGTECYYRQALATSLTSATTPTTTPPCNPCKMFVTAATFDGSMAKSGIAGTGATGIAKADDWCMKDANKPATGAFKALLVDTTNRIACTTANCSGGAAEHKDWVLYPGTPYNRAADGIAIATTDANGLITTSPHGNIAVAQTAVPVWTGLTSSVWTSSTSCNDWTSTATAAVFSYIGQSDNISVSTSGQSFCSTFTNALVCAEQ